jgi:hypothetical protein
MMSHMKSRDASFKLLGPTHDRDLSPERSERGLKNSAFGLSCLSSRTALRRRTSEKIV